MSNYTGAHIIVSGVVQGVGFRWFVVQHAQKLGVNGWARNRSDGTVEIECEGTRGAVEALLKEVRVGPRFSTVRDMQVEWREFESKFDDFDVRF